MIAGDFNMTPDNPLFRPFRRAYQEGFEAAGWGLGNTFPSGQRWIALDHILTDRSWRVRSCRVLDSQGSDHRPIAAELDLERLSSSGR